MKQTKSALTMLLAHYRAIYKHAILAAFVAASTLAAGSASADALAKGTTIDVKASETKDIDETWANAGTGTDTTVESITIAANGKLTAKPKETSANQSLTLINSGKTDIQGTLEVVANTSNFDLTINSKELSVGATATLKTAASNKLTLSATDKATIGGKIDSSGTITIDSSETTISGLNVEATGDAGNTDFTGAKTILSGTNTITKGNVNFKSTNTEIGGTLDIKATNTVDLSGTTVTTKDATITNAGTLKFGDKAFNLSTIAAKYSATGAKGAANAGVLQGQNLSVDSATDLAKFITSHGTEAKNGAIQLGDSSKSGKLTIGGTDVIDLTGKVANAKDGGVIFSTQAGSKIIAENVKLTASAGTGTNIALTTKNLTLAKGNAAFTAALGAKTTITNNLDTTADGATITDSFTLDASTALGGNGTGTITGKSLTVGDGSQGTAVNVNIANGAWTSSADLSLLGASGKVTKLNIASTNGQASLAFDAGKELAVDANSSIEIGKNGTLDITNANVDGTVSAVNLNEATSTLLVKDSQLSKTAGVKAIAVKKGGTVELRDETGTGLGNYIGSDVISITEGTLVGNEFVKTSTTGALDLGSTDIKANFNFNSAKLTADATNTNVTIKKGTLSVKETLSVAKADGTKGSLTVDDTAQLKLQGDGLLDVTALVLGGANNGNMVVNGAWTLGDANLELATANTNKNLDGIISLIKGASLTSTGLLHVKESNTIAGAEGSSLGFGKLNVEASKVLTLKGSTLVINGIQDGKDADKETGKGDITLAGNVALNQAATLEVGANALSDIVNVNGEYTPSGSTTPVKGIVLEKDAKSKITADATSTLKLNLAAENTFTLESLKNFRADLGTNFKGFVNMGDAKFTDADLKPGADGKYKWDDVSVYAESKFTNNALDKATVSLTSANAGSGVMGSFGALANESSNNVNLNNTTYLKNAAGNGGFFVSKTVAGKVVAGDVTTKPTADLVLSNGGSIGKVTLAEKSDLIVDGNGTTNFTSITSSNADSAVSFNGGKVNVAKDSKVTNLSLNATDAVFTTLTATNANLKGSHLKADTLIVGGTNTESKLDKSNIDVSTLNVAGDIFVGDSSFVNAKDLTSGTNTGSITVGHVKDADDLADTRAEQAANLFAKDATNFKGDLIVASGVEKASIAVIAKSDAQVNAVAPKEPQQPDPASFRVGSPVEHMTGFGIKGNTSVGPNAVVALGFDSYDSALAVLKENKVVNANGQVADDKAVLAINKPTVVNASLNVGDVAAKAGEGKAVIGGQSQIVMTESAFGEGKKYAALNANDITVNDVKETSGLVVGNFTAADTGLHVFNSATASVEGFKVYTANGVLVAKLDKFGNIGKFEENPDYNAKATLFNASTPVREYVKQVALGKDVKKLNVVVKGPESGENQDVTPATLADNTEQNGQKPGENQKPVEKPIELSAQAYKAFNQTDAFINSLTNSNDGGKSLEQSARFAVYGGAIKGAELGAKAGYEAIQGYADGSVASATAQTEMGSFFVVPTYKSSDSDSFNAEGLDFGSDINLSGVALGTDFVVAPAIKLGAMFSIGTGDAKGQGAASGVDSDLDYVGGGLFASYAANGINVVADLSYTKSGSDITATIKDGQVKADIDTKVLSLGVKGSYKFDLDGSYAQPYAGIRFSKYDIEDYSLQNADGLTYMTNSFDDMTVVSVPVGIQLGTDIMAGDWSLTPSLDLGVTFNLGDTDLSHSALAVTKTQGMNLTSEVIDDIVFGIKGGLKANYKGLSLGLGLGYDMGSNSDDLSVQASAKYTF